MTKTLVIFGDSLVDAGNTSFVFSQLGLGNPYQDSVYAGGGNVKASDGLVLGELVALEMGARVDDSHLISILSSEAPREAQVHNYAHSFAKTDFSPMLSEELGIGLKQQLNSFMERADYYTDRPDVDVILACGGNDMYAIFSQIDEINKVLSTESNDDDREFVNDIVKIIVRNIYETVKQLDDIVDEIAVAGMTPMMELPDSQDWLTNFPSEDQAQEASKLISKIGRKVTRRLQKRFESNPDVHVNNGYKLFDQVEWASFVDGFHPDSETSSKMAKLFVAEMSQNLDTFGFLRNQINSVIGKGKLRGTEEADQFTFDQFETFGGKTADRIIGFDASQGDTIGVSVEAFPSLQAIDVKSLGIAKSKRALKRLGRQGYDFVYFEPEGKLFFNGNGSDKGWGDPDEGGFVAILKGTPELSVEDFTLLAWLQAASSHLLHPVSYGGVFAV